MSPEFEHTADALCFSIIIPCFNEKGAIRQTVEGIRRDILADPCKYELIIVDDGSTDGSLEVLRDMSKNDAHLSIISHGINRGYGAALKTGIRRVHSEFVVITDADGTYPNDRIPELVEFATKADMIVGSRTAKGVQYSVIRRIPKAFLMSYASWIAGRRIPDMNSGLRVMRRSIVERFLGILPDGFSFTTTITLAMLTNYYNVRFVPITYEKRIGKSKIRPIRDTLRFIQLILRTGMYFAPLRVFFPVGVLFGILFLISLVYDVMVAHNLTDKTLLLFVSGVNTIMFALIADMIDKRTSR